MKHRKLYVGLLSLLIVLVLGAGILYMVSRPVTPDAQETPPTAGGGPSGSAKSGGQGIGVSELLQFLREKYDDDDPITYKKPLYDLPKDQIFHFGLLFDPETAGFKHDELSLIVDVFSDAALTNSVEAEINYDAETGQLTIAPPSRPVFEPRGDYDFPGFGSTYWDSRDSGNDWGYASKYYFAEFYAPDGEPLAKPAVTIFTVQRELDAPQNLMFYKDDGFLALQWDPVEGAEGYLIYEISYGYNRTAGQYIYLQRELASTTDTRYVHNYVFQMTFVCEINMAFYYEAPSDYAFELAVVAIGGGDASSASASMYSKDIAPILPHMIVFDAEDGDNELLYHARSVDELGLYRLVLMCDNSRVKMPVTYLIEEAAAVNLRDEYPEVYKEDFYVLLIPYEIKGTALRSMAALTEYDYPELAGDLLRLKEREAAVASGSGRLEPGVNLSNSGGDPGAQDPDIRLDSQDNVFATTALGEYLAVNMLNGMEAISLSDFPESYNNEYLLDAWYEAVYQNPLILGVKGISRDGPNNIHVAYNQPAAEQQRKQQEIKTEVSRVVSGIIRPDMTDLEKEIAINDYLCESVEYDMAALENAEKNNFKFTDSEFDDSFTAYGILLNKKGVCAGYAATFKLLAEAAELDCIVVTGYLYGDLPHAWNRVYIEGEWMTLDSTNNNDENLPNVLLNLPDQVACTVLVEDDRYISANSAGLYTGARENLEYYRINGRFCTQEQIVGRLAEGLTRDGAVTLRTDYDLTERQMYEITRAVARQVGFENIDANGWLGAIYMALNQ